MKKMLFTILLLISIILIVSKNEPKNFTGPMGYEMQYIRTISETELEYRDTQTGIHYIVLNDNTIKSPIFKNVNLELLTTE